MFVNVQIAWRIAGFERDEACAQLGTALGELTFFEHGNQFSQACCIGIEFQKQFKCAATGQAKAMGFVGADALFQAHGRTVGDGVGFAVLRNEVVFNAAARHRAHHGTCFAQSHDRAHRAWRRAPSSDNGGEQRALPSFTPSFERSQHHNVEVFHDALNLCREKRLAHQEPNGAGAHQQCEPDPAWNAARSGGRFGCACDWRAFSLGVFGLQ